jgi:hypothetical protein
MRTIEHVPAPSGPRDPRGPGRPSRVVLIVAVLVLLMGGLTFAVVRDTGGSIDHVAVSPTTAVPETTSPAPTTAPAATAIDRSTVIWPFAGSAVRYTDPVDAARTFATTYLRFQAPVVGAFQQGDTRSGEVQIRATGTGPVTTVMVRPVTSDDAWFVLGAATTNIDVTIPGAGSEIASPVHIAGRAHTFEGNVVVEIREDGATGPIGKGVVTGGGDEMRPFQGDIPFETAGSAYGALVFFTESAENGQVWEAAALPVRLRSTDADAAACRGYRSPRQPPTADQMELKAYFTCGDTPLVPVYRLVPRSSAVLRASLDALLAGPSADERSASIGSWFSADTARMLRSVAVDDHHVIVDFDPRLPDVIPNASSSAGSAQLLSQLDATVFQFRSVESAEYRLGGDCEAFSEWLQYGGCEPRTREASSD